MRTLPPVLLLCLSGCAGIPTDPARTGVAIAPTPGQHEGPVDLVIRNLSDGDIVCTVLEDELCPSLGDALDGLDPLPPGERWQVKDVDCVLVDITCLAADATDQDLPLRTWSWFVDPDDEG